jgi:hypothetical protein
MPWAMAAPALPMAFMISRKNLMSGINVAILIASITTMLANVFLSLIMRVPGDLRTDIYLAGILMEFSLAMVMLWSSTSNRIIRILIIAAGVMLCGAIASLIFLKSEVPFLKTLLTGGHLTIACLAFATLTHEVIATYKEEKFLTDIPNYWIQAGHLFHFGSMTIVLSLATGNHPSEWAALWDFGLLFTISTCSRFILFSAAVMAGRRQPVKYAEAPAL